jgi:hypothetical protein
MVIGTRPGKADAFELSRSSLDRSSEGKVQVAPVLVLREGQCSDAPRRFAIGDAVPVPHRKVEGKPESPTHVHSSIDADQAISGTDLGIVVQISGR